jgi:hypothetical protein
MRFGVHLRECSSLPYVGKERWKNGGKWVRLLETGEFPADKKFRDWYLLKMGIVLRVR